MGIAQRWHNFSTRKNVIAILRDTSPAAWQRQEYFVSFCSTLKLHTHMNYIVTGLSSSSSSYISLIFIFELTAQTHEWVPLLGCVEVIKSIPLSHSSRYSKNIMQLFCSLVQALEPSSENFIQQFTNIVCRKRHNTNQYCSHPTSHNIIVPPAVTSDSFITKKSRNNSP